MMQLLWQSFCETVLMVSLSSFFAIFLGGVLGTILNVTGLNGLYPHPWLYRILSFWVNVVRSIPYIILTVLMIPFTRIFVGSSIGTMAAVIPLTVAGLLLIARSVEDALREVPQGLLDVGIACGAKRRQIVWKILLPEALPAIAASATLVTINIIGFSAMAGAVGGGGLGDLAIRYGYQRYDLELLFFIVIALVVLVQIVQTIGAKLVKHLGC
ncbi:MAG: methionine ABC transporter permease [Alphaproteobacteria bacterium]